MNFPVVFKEKTENVPAARPKKAEKSGVKPDFSFFTEKCKTECKKNRRFAANWHFSTKKECKKNTDSRWVPSPLENFPHAGDASKPRKFPQNPENPRKSS